MRSTTELSITLTNWILFIKTFNNLTNHFLTYSRFLMHPCFPEQDQGSIQRLETLVVLTDVFFKTIWATRWLHHTMSNQPLFKRKNLWLLSKALTSLLHLYFCLNRWLPTNPCADTMTSSPWRTNTLSHSHIHTLKCRCYIKWNHCILWKQKVCSSDRKSSLTWCSETQILPRVSGTNFTPTNLTCILFWSVCLKFLHVKKF